MIIARTSSILAIGIVGQGKGHLPQYKLSGPTLAQSRKRILSMYVHLMIIIKKCKGITGKQIYWDP